MPIKQIVHKSGEEIAVDSATPYVASYDPTDAGKIAHYMFRWRMSDGTLGTWGETVSATITG